MRVLRAWLLLAAVACSASCGGAAPPAGDDGPEGPIRALEDRVAEEPDHPVLRYNLGTVLLQDGRHDAARPHLEAASRTGAQGVRQAAYYNLGSADLEPAFEGRGSGAERERLVRAITAYKRALLLHPGDEDAKWNLELARRLLQQQTRSPDPPPEPQGGGGGGGGGGRGGGGGQDPQSGRQDPNPQSAGGSGPQPPLSRAAAERLLAGAEQREVGLQRQKLRKQQPRTTSAH